MIAITKRLYYRYITLYRMILSDKKIKYLIKNEIIEITPYEEKNLNPSSINLTIGKIEGNLVSTVEKIFLPNEYSAQFLPRSSYIRKGGIMSTGHVDPGFNGHLTTHLSIVPELFSSPFQLVIYQTTISDDLYDGHYQGSVGVRE